MKNKIRFYLLIIGTAVFTFVFWKQSIGLNSIIFSAFLVGSLLYLFPESIKSKNALIIYTGTILTSLSIVFHASSLSIFVWIMSLFFLQPVVQYSKIKTLLLAGLTGIANYALLPMLLQENIRKDNKTFKKTLKIFKVIRFIAIPIIVLWLFYWIYKIAVPEFDKLTNSFLGKINIWFTDFFENVSFNIIPIIIWAFITMAWYLYKRKIDNLGLSEDKYSENIKRKRGKELFNFSTPTGLKPLLKYENTIATILIISVNFLLLTVNYLDITTIWFNFEYTVDFDLKQFVHAGTYLLILSILLSIAIMLFYFRANLNFYKKNKVLKISAYVWILQNLILLISVIIRNLHYIEHFALAYLRIGLFFFLSLVILGLITLLIKIKSNKSLFYLIKTNSWALYIGFVLFAIPDWDSFIANYNSENYPEAFVEASFMITLDEKTYPIIVQNEDLLKQDSELNTYRYFSDDYDVELDKRIKKFMKKYPDKSWQSWNYSDYKAYNYFIEKGYNK